MQVKDCTLVMRVNSQWNAEVFFSFITSKIGMSFETLGAKWLMAAHGTANLVLCTLILPSLWGEMLEAPKGVMLFHIIMGI